MMFANGHEMSRSQASKSELLQLRRQQLVALNAEIEALESTDTFHLPPHSQPSRRTSSKDDRRHIPRHMPGAQAMTMSRGGSLDAITTTHRVTKSSSQQTSRPQARHHSVSVPFGCMSTMPPLPSFATTESRFDSNAVSLENSFNDVNLKNSSPNISQQRCYVAPKLSSMSNRYAGLEDLADPGEYLVRSGLPSLRVTPAQSYHTVAPMLPASLWNDYDPLSPLTTSTVSLTYAHSNDQTTTMSRSPSLLYSGFDMLRLDSTTSFNDLENISPAKDDVISASSQSFQFSTEDQTHLLSGTGGVSDTFVTEQHAPEMGSVAMERNSSNESNSSTASRSRQRLQTQNQEAASRAIAPRGNYDRLGSYSSSSQDIPIVGNLAGVNISSKTAYLRRKLEPARCDACNISFRGDHELRRHHDRVHKPRVKKWMVVQPQGGGRVEPILPLTKCKACGPGQKKYGAYYNVAAHLRRAHFKPKIPKKLRTKEDMEEKRGGKGGGKWPPMSELKHWMMEVEEVTSFDHKDPAQPDDHDAELSGDEGDQDLPPCALNDTHLNDDDANHHFNDVDFSLHDASSDTLSAHDPLPHNGFGSQGWCDGPAFFTNSSSQRNFSSFSDASFALEDSNDMLRAQLFGFSTHM